MEQSGLGAGSGAALGVRLGVVAVDPLRAIGLGAILEELLPCTILPISVESIGRDRSLAAIVLDAATDDAPTWPLVTAVNRMDPKLPILVLGDILSTADVRTVHAAGALGYLSNTAAEAEIQACVSSILQGVRWPLGTNRDALAEPDLEQDQMEGPHERPVPLRDRLTPRECEVMDLLLDGRSNREIALSMGIDEATVKAHLGRMLRKAGCTNRVELTLTVVAERR